MKTQLYPEHWDDNEDFESHLPFEGRFIGALDDGDQFELMGRVVGIIRRDTGKLRIGFKIIIGEPEEIAGRRADIWFQRGGFPGTIQIHDDDK